MCAFTPEDWTLIDRRGLVNEPSPAIEQAHCELCFSAVKLLLEPYGITPYEPDG